MANEPIRHIGRERGQWYRLELPVDLDKEDLGLKLGARGKPAEFFQPYGPALEWLRFEFAGASYLCGFPVVDGPLKDRNAVIHRAEEWEEQLRRVARHADSSIDRELAYSLRFSVSPASLDATVNLVEGVEHLTPGRSIRFHPLEKTSLETIEGHTITAPATVRPYRVHVTANLYHVTSVDGR